MSKSPSSTAPNSGRTFKKRPGTTDKGKDYEDFMIASLIPDFLTDDNIQDFAVWSNDVQFGAIDDVIVELQSRDKEFDKFALQLKHIGQSKQLNLNSLADSKGNFAINKYFKSFQECKEVLSGYTLILLTNLRFKLDASKKVLIQMKDAEGKPFQVTVISDQVHPKLNTNKNVTECYKFEMVEGVTNTLSPRTLEEYKTFFEKFFVYTDQINVDTLKGQIFRQMKECLFCDQNISENYVKFILEWSRQEGTKAKLNKEMMQKVITLSLVSPFIRPISFGEVSENSKILQQATSKFHVTIFHENSIDNLEKVWGDARNDINEGEIKILNRSYQISSEKIQDIQNLNDIDWTKLLWIMGKCPLIIKECSAFYNVVELCSDRQFIVIVENVASTSRLLQSCSVFRNLTDLKPFDDIISNLCKKFTVSLSGQQLNLEYLVSEEKNFGYSVTTNELLKITENPYELTQVQEELVVPYVNRFLSRNNIDVEYLDHVDNGTLIVISKVDSKEDFNLFKKYKPIYVEECINENRSKMQPVTGMVFAPRRKIYISEKLCSQDEFDFICSTNKMMQIFHHFKVADGCLEWLKSHKRSDISKLERYRMKSSFLNENELLTMNFENNIHIITGDPGMGKSCLLRNLKNMSSEIWTIMFTPQDITQICDFLRRHKDNIEDVEDFILKMKYEGYKDFDKDLVKLLMRKKQVVYFWDALDEIVCDDNLDITIKLIKRFSEEKIVQWITCRLHLRKSLESKFNVCSREIAEFTKEQQIYYITERLKDLLSDSETLEDVTTKIRNNIGLFHCNDILGIPLQIYMLTELCRRDIQKYSALLEQQFLLTDLYKYFIDEKFIFFYKDKIKFNDLQANRLKQTQKNHLRIFEVAALRTLLDDETFKLLRIDHDYFLEEVMVDGDCFGFLSEISENESTMEISFSHNSYAEYLVAVYISKYKEKLNLKDILFKEKYTNVRYFFDMLLAQCSPAHIAVLYRNLPQVKKCDSEIYCKDLGGRSVLQIAASWGTRYNLLKCRRSDNEYILEAEPSSIPPESLDYLDMIDYLLEKCNFNENDSLFSLNAVEYAETTHCVFVLAVIENKHKFGYFASKSDDLNCSTLYYTVRLNLKQFLPLFEKYLKWFKTERCETLLHVASRSEYYETVDALIAFGVNINASDQYGWTSLHRAAFSGHRKVVEVLVKSGANLNDANVLGRETPLHLASEQGHKEIVEFLVKSGTNVNILDNVEHTPLHLASQNGHLETVKLLTACGANINSRHADGWTPLHWACYNGHNDIIEYLVKIGVNVNITDSDNSTPLYIACRYGHCHSVELLIKLEAQHVNMSVKSGNWTPLYAACRCGYTNIVRLLIEHGADVNVPNLKQQTPIFAAAKYGHNEIVLLLLQREADVNIKNRDSCTPLYAACENGHYLVAKTLIEHGANILTSQNQRRIPLIAASRNGHEKIVELLITSGAKIDVHDGMTTPLYTACAFGHEKVVDLLLINSGSDIKQWGHRAFYQAAEYGHFRVVETLIRHGFDINIPDTDGNMMIHIASKEGQERVVETLIKHGSDVNCLNNLGMSSLHLAASEGHLETVKTLINYEALIDERDAYGSTPLIHSCIWGRENVSELLILSKADVNIFDNNGLSPIGAAFHNRHNEIVDLLLASGANSTGIETVSSTPLYVFCELGDIRSVTCCIWLMGARAETVVYNGWSAIHIACFKGYKQIVEQLLQSPAVVNVNTPTKAGDTPIELARQNGHQHIVELIENITK